VAVALGLDFGTTNSTIAVADDAGVRFARFGHAAATTFRSVLYFDPDARGRDGRPLTVAGPDAIDRYLAADGEGRLIQSMKSYLASRTFRATQVFTSVYTLEMMIGLVAADLRAAATGQLGGPPARVVVGRPVRFAGADTPEDDAYALARLRAALGRAGFDPDALVFEHEPVAAAYHYESRLTEDKLVLIADFGGGTSDFCLLRIGPDARRRGDRDILGTEGVALAGDAFDGRIVRHLVAPELGRGGSYVVQGKVMPVPPWLFGHLERWHHLSFLKSAENLALLERIHDGSSGPARARIAAFRHVVDADLGHHLYRAVERTKIALSSADRAAFHFPDPAIAKNVARADFDRWIAPELDAIAACVDRLLGDAGVAPADVDQVFMTGGSSFVPAVRGIFAARFGADKLYGGDELVSIASGLALRARDLAGA
jgi:hypothetical chaperone protein